MRSARQPAPSTARRGLSRAGRRARPGGRRRSVRPSARRSSRRVDGWRPRRASWSSAVRLLQRFSDPSERAHRPVVQARVAEATCRARRARSGSGRSRPGRTAPARAAVQHALDLALPVGAISATWARTSAGPQRASSEVSIPSPAARAPRLRRRVEWRPDRPSRHAIRSSRRHPCAPVWHAGRSIGGQDHRPAGRRRD